MKIKNYILRFMPIFLVFSSFMSLAHPGFCPICKVDMKKTITIDETYLPVPVDNRRFHGPCEKKCTLCFNCVKQCILSQLAAKKNLKKSCPSCSQRFEDDFVWLELLPDEYLVFLLGAELKGKELNVARNKQRDLVVNYYYQGLINNKLLGRVKSYLRANNKLNIYNILLYRNLI